MSADGATTILRPTLPGIHSLDRFVVAVPDLEAAAHFYRSFGLDVREVPQGLALHTFGHPHQWGLIVEGPCKRLHHLSFGAYADDMPAFRDRLVRLGIPLIDAPAGFESNGLWLRDPDGTPVEIKVAPKCMADAKATVLCPTSPAGVRGAPNRSVAELVRPRRLGHVLLFTGSVDASVRFYIEALGLGLSDRSRDIVAFLHGVHGSDHHLLAFAGSSGPGFHHSSWDVASVDEVGRGSKQMADQGYTKGWGLGRHVLGSNYFHYVGDPWGSYAEYSCDIDYVPAGGLWEARDHQPEDALYVWGPDLPPGFVTNHEVAA